jgi:LmbE family N-acetylglucosaminyl deacetylase
MTTLIISPHLDDAVLSCGAALAAMPGATVLTVFAGSHRDHSDWDRRAGFRTGQDVAALRRAEDLRALGSLGVVARWLDELDAAYRAAEPEPEPEPDPAPIVDAIVAAAAGVERLVFPVGLQHPDHVMTFDLALAASRRLPGVDTIGYADAPYCFRDPETLSRRVVELRRQGFDPRTTQLARGPRWRKHRAVRAYTSQCRALGPGTVARCTLIPERYWRLSV